MTAPLSPPLQHTTYNQNQCKNGIVHLGFGAFHRAHQAQYIDRYMQLSGDLSWGISAVNLRAEETTQFAANAASQTGYVVKSIPNRPSGLYLRARPFGVSRLEHRAPDRRGAAGKPRCAHVDHHRDGKRLLS